MSTAAEVTILHLTNGEARGPGRDGAFRVVRVAASAPSPIEEAILLAALHSSTGTGRLPSVAGRQIHALEGGFAGDICGQIAACDPDVLVIAGLNQAWPPDMIDALPRRPRVATMPLTGDDRRIGLDGYRDLVDAADVVLTTSPAERSFVEALRPTQLVELPLPIPVNLTSAAHRVAGLTNFDNYAVFLRGFPDGTVEHQTTPDYLQLRDAVPGLGFADISHQRWRVHNDDFDYVIPIGPSRVNLLRLLSHAVALVDLRPGGVIAREAIESLLIGTPVVVPTTSRARGVVEESGGGYVFAAEDELAGALGSLAGVDGSRDEIAARGREWARRMHGDQGRFVAEVTGCLFGS